MSVQLSNLHLKLIVKIMPLSSSMKTQYRLIYNHNLSHIEVIIAEDSVIAKKANLYPIDHNSHKISDKDCNCYVIMCSFRVHIARVQ